MTVVGPPGKPFIVEPAHQPGRKLSPAEEPRPTKVPKKVPRPTPKPTRDPVPA